MSKINSCFQGLIKSCNVFTSPVNFRYQLEPDYNTFAGGLISIILILLLMSIFYSSWMSLLNKTDITSSTQIIRQFDPTQMEVNSDQFMFAIGVNGINLTDFSQNRYFDLTMTKVEMIKGDPQVYNRIPFTLEPCKMEHWQHLGQQFVQTYRRQDFSAYLCPSRNVSMKVSGKWTSQTFEYFEISIDRCKGSGCKTEDQINQFITIQKSFYFNFFYSNTLLNPDQTKPISKFLQDKDYSMFSTKISTFTNIYLGQYVMKTDQSIFPWNEEEVHSGFIVDRAQNQVFTSIPSVDDAYCQLVLRKSNVKLQINRKFRKLDDLLSYIGGLFGIIAVAVGFVVKYYGQCSFELEMCQKIFDYHNKKQTQEENRLFQTANVMTAELDQIKETKEQTQKVIEPKDFGFLDFFIHILVYLPIKKLFNIKWKKMEVYEESLEEMRYKLDISQLMEKLNFYDRSVNALFDENQLKLLYLQDKCLFQQVRAERKMLWLREDLNANLFQSKENNISDESDLVSKRQYKKSLKQIARMKTKRMKSFMGHRMSGSLNKQLENKQGNAIQKYVKQGNHIPGQIKKALQLLDQQIDEGDVVATRIYNGLQYELLEAYQKSKNGDHKYTFVPVSIVNFQKRTKEGAKSLGVLVREKEKQEDISRKHLKTYKQTKDIKEFVSVNDMEVSSRNEFKNLNTSLA